MKRQTCASTFPSFPAERACGEQQHHTMINEVGWEKRLLPSDFPPLFGLDAEMGLNVFTQHKLNR